MTKRMAIIVAGVLLAAHPAGAETAKQILKGTGVTGGLIVHVGCGTGELTASLRAGTRFIVHGLDADAANVAKAREHVRKAGLAGSVWIDPLRGPRLPYAENMVNLLVAEDPGDVPMAEVMRVLVPLGAAYVDGKKVVKPWPEDIDEWTHWLHGADGNAVADDRRAGPPRRFKWIARPLWSRSHDSVPSVSAMVSAKGRLFYIVDEAPASMAGSAPDKWALVARDAFNGLELWRVPIARWGWEAWSTKFTVRFTVPTHMPRRLAAVGDRVYVTLGFNAPLVALDAATGKVRRRFEGTQYTDEILCTDDSLIVSMNKGVQKPGPKSGPSPKPVRKWVAAIDSRTGKMRWKVGDYVGLRSKTGDMERISHLSMVAGGGHVFFVDADKLVSLDMKDGSETWRIARPEVPEHKMRYNIRLTDMCTLVYGKGMVFFAQLDPGPKRIGWREVKGKVHAFSAETGKEIWSRQCSSWGWGHPADVFVLQGLVWVTDFKNDFVLGLDPKTGQVKRKVSNHKAFDNGHHHRCYRNKATERFMVTGYRGMEFIDWTSDKTDRNHWVRGVCRLGVMPCNGMIYAPPHPCRCYITSKLNGFVALGPASTEEGPKPPPARLEKGPAYGAIGNRKSEIGNSSAWPTYRHDARRSGATAAKISTPLKTIWQVDLGGPVTAPVVAGGRLYVAAIDEHVVHCIDARDGKPLWAYTAGGRVDTPPTLYRGRAVFGCMDGWVYCLRATDGALMWRFRAAPRQRLVGAFGGIESAWPVHGSVLVCGTGILPVKGQHGQDARATVYCTAGRSSFLDGGIHAYALEIDTGKVIAHETVSSAQDMDVDTGTGDGNNTDTGALTDLLVAGDGGIFLRQRRLFGKSAKSAPATHLHATGGLLDNNWFQRTRWYLGDTPLAEYLVFRDKRVYGVRARKNFSGYGGHFVPGAKGFDLFAADLTPRKAPAAPAPKPKRKRRAPKVPVPKDRWCVKIPVRVTAMLLAGDTLIAAGTPDALGAKDPWAAYEGRRGGKVLIVSAADGKIQAEIGLPAPPVPDGLAVAGGRVYLATKDGRLLCMQGTK